VAIYLFFGWKRNEVAKGVPQGVVGCGTLGEAEFPRTVGSTASKAEAHGWRTPLYLGRSLKDMFSRFKVFGSFLTRICYLKDK
jgi:hypothetical protein